jgi:hypothetical protein
MKSENQFRVYFALSPSAKEVKIGVSSNPPGRIKEMQVARPDIELLADIPGSKKTEAHLHHRFSQFRIAGEWFRFGDPIQNFLEDELPIFVKEALPVVESRQYVRNLHLYEVHKKGRSYWRLRTPNPSGAGFIERQFSDKTEATLAFDNACIKHINYGAEILSPKQRDDAITALEIIKPLGITLIDVARFYVAHPPS